MISDLKPYPTYKKSSVRWLGQVPNEWTLAPARSLFEEIIERNHPDEEMLSVTIEAGVIRQVDLLQDTRSKDASNLDKSSYKLVKSGDIVYNKMRAWQGAVGLSSLRGIVSPAYIVMRSRGAIHPVFAHMILRTPVFAKEAERWSYGITSDQWSLRARDFKQIYFPVPSVDAQAAIIRFIAYFDARIQRLIAAKERLVHLLEEEKQAFILHALTEGLNPDVALKASEVEWLGDIPESWDAVRLKDVTTPMEQGWSPQCEAQQAGHNEWGVLKVGCVNSEVFDDSQSKRLPLELEARPWLEIRPGDILVSRANTRELLGLAALAEKPQSKLLLSDKLFRFRAISAKINPKFLVAAIRQLSSRSQIESAANGASDSMQNISQDVIRNLWFSLPPLHEQDRIVIEIESRQALANGMVRRTRQQVKYLREYRSRLITDVVTGKLDVREVAARLPTDPAQDAPLLEEQLERAAP